MAGVQLQQAGQKMKDVGDKITGVGTSLSTHVTAPIAAVGAASLAAFKEVDEGADIVTQKTGASGKALKEMQDAANDIATSIPTDFATAGSAIGEVNTRFGLTGDKLKKLSQQFVEFASLNDTDVSTCRSPLPFEEYHQVLLPQKRPLREACQNSGNPGRIHLILSKLRKTCPADTWEKTYPILLKFLPSEMVEQPSLSGEPKSNL